MNHKQLAEALVLATDGERRKLLTQYTDLADVTLAWALKAHYDNSESSDVGRAAQAATALKSLARAAPQAEVEAVATWVEGMALTDGGQMEAALAQLHTAEEHFLALGRPRVAAATQKAKMRALAMLGRFDEALESGQRARRTLLS